MPTLTDASLQGWFLFPARPSLVLPMMLIAPDHRTLLVAPLEQLPRAGHGGRRRRCAAGGTATSTVVPAGFTTELAIWAADARARASTEWGGELHVARTAPCDPAATPTTSTAGPRTGPTTAPPTGTRPSPATTCPARSSATVDDLRARDVPFGTVQLDSWFYPHATLRPFDTDEWVVPPSG